MLKFCEFPNINGLVSLCTGELVSVVSNIYLVVITIVAIILVRVQKTCNSRRWSCHTLIWVIHNLKLFFMDPKHFYFACEYQEV